MIPGWGDAKGFKEAYENPSAINILAAGAGVLGPVGDRVGKFIKQADNLVDAGGAANKIPWGIWSDYPKVTQNVQEYALVGGRLYSEHAVNRMQPSLRRHSSSGTTEGMPEIYRAGNQYDYGRGVRPQFVEDVISTSNPIRHGNGNFSYRSGSLEMIINLQGAVVTIINH